MLIAITCEHIIIFYFIEMGFNDLLSALQVSYIQFQKRNTELTLGNPLVEICSCLSSMPYPAPTVAPGHAHQHGHAFLHILRAVIAA